MTTDFKFDKKQKIRLFLVLLLAIGIYGILPQYGNFKGSFDLLGSADMGMVVMAVIASFATYIFGAFNYYALAIKPITFGRTILVQLAVMFINRILPAGIGAIGANTAYLHRFKHTVTQSAAIVSLNNLLGMLGHVLLLVVAYLIWRNSVSFDVLSGGKVLIATAIIITIVLSLSILIYTNSSKKIKNIRKQLAKMLTHYNGRPQKVIFALLGSILLTTANTACLWFSLQAVGVDISPAVALILLTMGVGAGTAIPTPGGLGGVEAGIYAGLIAFNIASVPALAGVLMFRLASYWIPLTVGAVALVYVQKKKWLIA